MTKGEFSTYLLFVAFIFGVLGVVNLLRPTKRWIGAASILWGVAAILYRESYALPVVGVACALAVFCLGMQAKGHQRRPA